jgi:hypothetical protein
MVGILARWGHNLLLATVGLVTLVMLVLAR